MEEQQLQLEGGGLPVHNSFSVPTRRPPHSHQTGGVILCDDTVSLPSELFFRVRKKNLLPIFLAFDT